MNKATERKARERERRKLAGQTRVEFWVPDHDVELVKRAVEAVVEKALTEAIMRELAAAFPGRIQLVEGELKTLDELLIDDGKDGAL